MSTQTNMQNLLGRELARIVRKIPQQDRTNLITCIRGLPPHQVEFIIKTAYNQEHSPESECSASPGIKDFPPKTQ